MRFYIGILIAFIMLLSGCGENPSTAKEPDYDQTKEMVVDILQTDEGKKALLEVISDDKMKQHLVMDSKAVKEAITEALVSEKGNEMWKKLFDDPDFAESFVESTKEGQKKLFKHLMNDAAFQKKMMDIMKDPEMADETIKLLKSQQFREHLEKTVQETMESPVFQAKMKEALMKAAEKETNEEDKSDGDEKKDSEDSKESGDKGGNVE